MNSKLINLLCLDLDGTDADQLDLFELNDPIPF